VRWARKQERCVVTVVKSDGLIAIQSAPNGGQFARRPSGKVVPRWSAQTVAENFRRDAATELWILGSGQVPKKVRGELVFPDLVVGKEPEKFPEGVVVIRPMPVNASIGTQPGRII